MSPRSKVNVFRHGRRIMAYVLSMGAVGASAAAANADGPIGAYMRIEQDWALVIGVPDANDPSPQVAIQLDPYQDSPLGSVLLLNYHDTPAFQGGGLQLQLWQDDAPISTSSHRDGMALNTAGETVQWTQFMELKNGNLSFGVVQGASQTWGSFAARGWTVSVPYGTLTSFTGYYQTSDTMTNSGILLGANAVRSLKLIAVRKYDANGKYNQEAGQQLYP